MLTSGEMVMSDKGYVNQKCVSPVTYTARTWLRSRIISQLETFKGRFKYVNVISNKFRHLLDLHAHYFLAVALLTQLQLNAEPLFSI